MTRLWSLLPGLIFTGISFLLFAYVAFGEATLVYSKMRNEGLIQLGTTVQFPIEQFAQSGLRLDQLTGFERRASVLFEIDEAIQAVQLFDALGQSVGCAVSMETDYGATACERGLDMLAADIGDASGGARVLELSQDAGLHNGIYAVSFPLSDKFGEVGRLVLWIDTVKAQSPVTKAFTPVLWIAAGLFLTFALVQVMIVCRGAAAAQRALTPSFLTVLAVLIGVLGTIMFDLYRQGTEGQAQATALSVASRIKSAVDLGLPLELFSGIPEMLEDYTSNNPSIAAISIVRGGTVLHKSPDQQHAGVESDGKVLRTLAFSQKIESKGAELTVTAEMPFSVVLKALTSGARNFIALFFGCFLFSNVLLKALRETNSSDMARSSSARPSAIAQLALLQPAYFIGVFADALVISILPEISARTVASEGLSPDLISLPFSLFFLGLTIALIPASMLADRMDLRRLLMIGGGLVAVGLLLVGGIGTFWALCAGRAIGGVGQGVLLIAMQAYAFELVDANNKIKASASQVLGYNGGLIAGTGIGGLLASFQSDYSVVLIAGAVAAIAVIYTFGALPALRKAMTPNQSDRPGGLFSDVRRILFLPDFFGVLLLAGITSKFALTGVAMFAMPLLLHEAGYANSEVGQALMVFAAVTYFVTAGTPRIIALLRSTDRTLLLGLVSIALGMVLFGLSLDALGKPETLWTPTWLFELSTTVSKVLTGSNVPAAVGVSIALALAFLGIGQGMIAAPIVARIATGPAANLVGRDRAIAVYRILERIGHILGPALLGGLLVTTGGTPLVVTSLGLVYLLIAAFFGLMLAFTRLPNPQRPPK